MLSSSELLAASAEYLINSLTFLFTLAPLCCLGYMGQEATVHYFLSDNASLCKSGRKPHQKKRVRKRKGAASSPLLGDKTNTMCSRGLEKKQFMAAFREDYHCSVILDDVKTK